MSHCAVEDSRFYAPVDSTLLLLVLGMNTKNAAMSESFPPSGLHRRVAVMPVILSQGNEVHGNTTIDKCSKFLGVIVMVEHNSTAGAEPNFEDTLNEP